MLTIGIDSGNLNTKAVALRNGEVVGRVKSATGFDAQQTAVAALEMLLRETGLRRDNVDAIAATGVGRQLADCATVRINEVGSAARGAHLVCPALRIVIDMGAEGCRAVKMDDAGRPQKYEVNDRCASGAGTFVESMARTLQIKTEEMGAYSLRHSKDVPMNAQCVVFAESEVISLIHRRETVEDIAHGIHAGIASRVAALMRRLGVTAGIGFIGGPANNAGLGQCLEDVLKQRVAVPDFPEYISALGAAAFAADQLETEQKE
ncbi:MAG: acyl-CoA dehydratase activase [Gracilibacteraceae bacterium]|jgi:benzoyl-CoA reductase subunit D|nr:acyl-CoA dehydratase activase [Gracilibacteraceae bacterium]